MSSGQEKAERYEKIAELARTMPYEPSSAELVRGWHRIRATGVRRWRGFAGRWGIAFAVAACAAAIVTLRPQRRGETLSYVVDGGVRGPAGEVAAGESAPAKVAFSDGSEFVLAPHARATVGALGESEPHVSLDDGRTEVHVRHRDGARWLVSAGPFVVTVTGTSFSLGWTESDRFQIEMHSGSVSVKGPLVEEGRSLGSGQALTIRVRSRELAFGAEPAGEDTPPAELAREPSFDRSAPARGSSEPASDAPERLANPSRAASQGRADKPGSLGWAVLLSRGKVAEIVADAESRGLDAATSQVGSDDLAALADAARYTRRADVARRALRALRARFPRGAAACDGAFFLGRLDESDGAAGSAMNWYRRYLDEAPQGTYASEALGRQMSLVVRLQGKAKAVPFAEQYLSRFPSGSYAASARSVLGRP
ncbi:MAG TPA: FecR family protein [Polyangiaceae bacterium]|nr:FecR family protein [Polyangiaceae bacterium]